jgi:hypothetical protein
VGKADKKHNKSPLGADDGMRIGPKWQLDMNCALLYSLFSSRLLDDVRYPELHRLTRGLIPARLTCSRQWLLWF